MHFYGEVHAWNCVVILSLLILATTKTEQKNLSFPIIFGQWRVCRKIQMKSATHAVVYKVGFGDELKRLLWSPMRFSADPNTRYFPIFRPTWICDTRWTSGAKWINILIRQSKISKQKKEIQLVRTFLQANFLQNTQQKMHWIIQIWRWEAIACGFCESIRGTKWYGRTKMNRIR